MTSRPPYSVATLFQPAGGIAEPTQRQIRAALAEAAQIAVPADPDRLQTVEAVRIIAAAGRQLAAAPPRWGAALAMVEAAPVPLRDRLPLQLLRLRAMARCGRLPEVPPEIARLLLGHPADPKRDAALVNLAEQLGIFPQVPHLPRLSETLWGAPKADLAATVAGLDLKRYRTLLPPGLLGFFCEARGLSPAAVPEVADGLARGLAATHFGLFTLGAEVVLLKRGVPPVARSDREQAVLNQAAAIHAGVAGSDLALLEQLRDQGRSVILLGSHLGMLDPDLADLHGLGMRMAVIHSGLRDIRPVPRRAGQPEVTEIRALDAAQMPFDLLRLAKSMRRSPCLVRIWPDGACSDALRRIEVCGRRFDIGTGAATLGYYGKAVLVFARSRWTGRNWQVDLQAGPDLAEARTPDDASDQLAGFYAQSLETQLLGPLMDIGGYGAAFPRLREQFI